MWQHLHASQQAPQLSYGHRLKRPRLREATILSLFQPSGVYKQANFSQIIQYQPCSCLDNISSPSPHLCLLPALLDVLFTVLKTSFPEVLFPEVETLPSSAPTVSSQHFVTVVIVSLILAVGLPGRAISLARCSSLPHSWAVTLPEVVPSLLKKLKWPHHLSMLWTTLSPVLQADWYLPHVKHCLAAHPMHAEEIPLKRHTDTCSGITTYIAHPLLVPPQEAYWYLPWDCYQSHTHLLCPLKRNTDTCPGILRSHSRGPLILAVGLLPIACTLIVPTQEAYWYLPFDCYLSHDHSLCPLKRHTDTYREIATYIARPLVVPTQEAYWYLPSDCYLHCTLSRCAHSRGILILAVALLPILHAHSFRPLKRHTDTCRGTATGLFSRPTLRPTHVEPLSVAWTVSQTFTLVVIVTCSGVKPTCAHSRDNTLNCRGPLTIIAHFEYI